MLLLLCNNCDRRFYHRKITACPRCESLMECLEGSTSEPPDTPGSHDEDRILYSPETAEAIGLENLQSHDEFLRKHRKNIQKVVEEFDFSRWFDDPVKSYQDLDTAIKKVIE